MRRRHAKLFIAIFFIILFTFSEGETKSSETPENYSQLWNYIAMEDLQDPLVLFEDHEGDFDRELNKENIAYLNQNKKLLKHIKTRLKGDRLHWKLAASTKRLLVVPEKRPEYARLFERYCHEAIEYVLRRIQAPNPYQSIATLKEPLAGNDDIGRGGIKALLVHNIADEYVEEYVFFNRENDATKIKVKLSNRVFNGKIGSYSSKLVIGEESHFEFEREPYTLWQNSAQNPLNVFIAPIEETLHIVLRNATETAIRENLQEIKPQKLEEVETVVDEWMAVEEAIVGGLVSQLMPEVLDRLVDSQTRERIDEAMAEREQHEQYRYVGKGIQVVIDLGLTPAISLYKSDPGQFRQLVSQPELAAVSS